MVYVINFINTCFIFHHYTFVKSKERKVLGHQAPGWYKLQTHIYKYKTLSKCFDLICFLIDILASRVIKGATEDGQGAQTELEKLDQQPLSGIFWASMNHTKAIVR